MFKIYDEPEWPNEAACLRYMMEPQARNEGACLRYMMNRNRQMGGRIGDVCDESGSPNEGSGLRCIMNWNRKMRRCDEPITGRI